MGIHPRDAVRNTSGRSVSLAVCRPPRTAHGQRWTRSLRLRFMSHYFGLSLYFWKSSHGSTSFSVTGCSTSLGLTARRSGLTLRGQDGQQHRGQNKAEGLRHCPRSPVNHGGLTAKPQRIARSVDHQAPRQHSFYWAVPDFLPARLGDFE